MLEKPPLKEEKIVACLERDFGLSVDSITFLPIGADLDTAVVRVVAGDGTPYFLKLRRGAFQEASVALPDFLSRQGVRQVIPALTTRTGDLWAELAPFKAILYPYVDGRNAYEAKMSEKQWVAFGAALRRFHAADVPAEITQGIPHETFSPRWREMVKAHLDHINEKAFEEPVAAEMAAFLQTERDTTLKLVRRAERLAQALQARPPDFNLCHGDIHGWNLLIDATGHLYIVDWDTLIFAPKERDLMFIGAGLGESGYTPQEEETLFYQGYGRTQVNAHALAYYRYERIIEDIAIFCEQIFMSSKGGQDRQQALAYLKSNYRPGSTIEVAMRSDRGSKHM